MFNRERALGIFWFLGALALLIMYIFLPEKASWRYQGNLVRHDSQGIAVSIIGSERLVINGDKIFYRFISAPPGNYSEMIIGELEKNLGGYQRIVINKIDVKGVASGQEFPESTALFEGQELSIRRFEPASNVICLIVPDAELFRCLARH